LLTKLPRFLERPYGVFPDASNQVAMKAAGKVNNRPWLTKR
jgi:hypothetical protein